jgi:hypothetical protein
MGAAFTPTSCSIPRRGFLCGHLRDVRVEPDPNGVLNFTEFGPILLRTTSSAGHGIGTALDEAIDQDADMFAFLFDQLGTKYEAPPVAP